jgi:hypothetical protein
MRMLMAAKHKELATPNAPNLNAVIRCHNVGSLNNWQEIWKRAIPRSGTSRPISAKCGLAGPKTVAVNP